MTGGAAVVEAGWWSSSSSALTSVPSQQKLDLLYIIIMGKLLQDNVLRFKHFVLENLCHTGRIILILKPY